MWLIDCMWLTVHGRLHNKGVYLKMGLRRMVNRKSCKDLHRHIKVEVDGKLIDLPPVEGIVILNILRWASSLCLLCQKLCLCSYVIMFLFRYLL